MFQKLTHFTAYLLQSLFIKNLLQLTRFKSSLLVVTADIGILMIVE